MAGPSLNDEIQSVTYLNIKPLLFHGYIGPFVMLYIAWFYSWYFVYGTEHYFEAGLIVLAVIGFLQILTSLFSVWSVDVRCLMSCSKVYTEFPKIK